MCTVVYAVYSQATTYHNGKQPYPQRQLLEATAERIRLSLHLCYEGRVWCACRRHIQHRRRGVVDSHDKGQQLDCCHTVGRCVRPHILVKQWCSRDGVSLPSSSLTRHFFVYSSCWKPEEVLLILPPAHHQHHSASAGDLVENIL